jgi:hypothetical protein
MLTWGWIIQITLISIILIFLVHHLLIFFKSVLTVPKVKDLVNSNNEKYKNIYETITNNNKITYNLEDILPPKMNVNTNENTSEYMIENTNDNIMKDELKSFLKTQLHK